MKTKQKRSPVRWVVWGLISASSLVLLAGTLGAWLPFGLAEVCGFITGAVCVMLTVEESIWNWPLGLANNVVFIILFLNQGLYGDMGLQFVYIILAIYGWQHWLRGGENRGRLTVRRTSWPELCILGGLVVAATAGMTVFLASIKDSAPFLDALTTVLSLAAQYLLTRKAIENWSVWIVADVLYIYLYMTKGLYLTALLYALFILLCLGGFRVWMARLKEDADQAKTPVAALRETAGIAP